MDWAAALIDPKVAFVAFPSSHNFLEIGIKPSTKARATPAGIRQRGNEAWIDMSQRSAPHGSSPHSFGRALPDDFQGPLH